VTIEERQAFIIKLPYIDGVVPNKKRPYLIINVAEERIETLKISSIEDKIGKLCFDENVLINNENPPFSKPSFVVINELYIINKNKSLSNHLLDNGSKLCETEFERIYRRHDIYKKNNPYNFYQKTIDYQTFYKFN